MPAEAPRETRRRLQVTGRATLTVSIPSEWAKEMGLKPGDEVGLALQPDRTILLAPRPGNPGTPLPPANLALPDASQAEALFRVLVAHYLLGYDTVRVAFPRGIPLETLRQLKGRVREKLVGMEVVEETSQSITFQNLVSHEELPLDRALHRMSVIVRSMHRDALQALRAGDANLAQEVVQRDHEADKFCLLVIRQLKEALRNVNFMRRAGIASSLDCMGYRVIVRSIERIGDHAENVA
ncbi:MAG: phosphate uptake regulator PhoU, partial [Halobacteria archaeon]